MKSKHYPVIIICTFVWIGFVCAISFMEAWLKFHAPGITLPLGLGIGRLVFNALNKVEWILALAIVLSLLFSGEKFFRPRNLLFLAPVILVALQTAWLLPALDTRAELHIQGMTVPPSNLHFYYVGAEAIKIICLFIFGISLFKGIAGKNSIR